MRSVAAVFVIMFLLSLSSTHLNAANTTNVLPPSSCTCYDTQILSTFTENTTSLDYIVIANNQSDPKTGIGPAYLLNGVTDRGYWFQMGLQYNWDYSGEGFTLAYEVFNSNGTSIIPANGGGGTAAFSGQINPNDSVELKLYISNGNVYAYAIDKKTGATAQEKFSAYGGRMFVGNPQSPADGKGFFTGLMTEWYRSGPSGNTQQEVTYSPVGTAPQGVWMCTSAFHWQSPQDKSKNTNRQTDYNGCESPSQIGSTGGVALNDLSATFQSGEFATGTPSAGFPVPTQPAPQVPASPQSQQQLDLCSILFAQSGSLSATFGPLGALSTYNGLLIVSIAAILMVFTVLGLLYGIGMAFGVQRIIAFVKTEYLESFLNLIIVIFLLLFFASIGNVSTFFSNIGTAIASSAGISTPPSVSNLHDIYNGICNTYYNDAISQLGALTVLSLQGYAFNILTSLTISLMPNGFGVSFSPFAGYGPFPTMITTATGIISGIAGLEGGVIFLLAVIYYIFPIFLFLGLVFRAFPWTRAAGGSFLALFISFYIIFPALIYPFSTVSAQGIATLETPQSFLPSGGIASAFISGAVSQSLPFTSMAAFIDGFVGSIINSAFQLFGIIIAFVISFNLLESFGDLLGAPALASRHMLSRVI